MSLLANIIADVEQIAKDRDMKDYQAFGYWFLESYQDFSEENADDIIIDGPWDEGRDAVYYDEENHILHIYQFKYSEDIAYVKKAFKDIQRGLEKEGKQLPQCREVKLYVLTLAQITPTLNRTIAGTKGHINAWVKTNYPHLAGKCDVIVIDMDYFRRMWDRIIGIPAELEFMQTPLDCGDSLIGLLNANGLKGDVDNDDLLTFNIRKFLGTRGSVNTEIKETLEDSDRRPRFWKMNNGLVCLCTDFANLGKYKYKFSNFTIVNGAQTITTIARYLADNPLAEPTWVLVKIIKVGQTEVDLARELTKSSNAQNATNDKDMRAIDPVHRIIQPWFKAEFGVNYIYKRGGPRIDRRDPHNIYMKDMCQAYVALSQPNISFARPSLIFSNNDMYTAIYPIDEIKNLQTGGSKPEIRKYLLQRLIPTQMLYRIRRFIKSETKDHPEEYVWRSTAYHLVWLYIQAFEQLNITDIELIHSKLDRIVDETIDDMYAGLRDYIISSGKAMPRDLKNTVVIDDLRSKGIFFSTLHKRSKEKIAKIITS